MGDRNEIGSRLIAVKDALGHGRFGRWLEAEFQWSEPTAERMMRVADTFKSVKLTDLNIGQSALYMLASPSTPAPIRHRRRRARSSDANWLTDSDSIRVLTVDGCCLKLSGPHGLHAHAREVDPAEPRIEDVTNKSGGRRLTA